MLKKPLTLLCALTVALSLPLTSFAASKTRIDRDEYMPYHVTKKLMWGQTYSVPSSDPKVTEFAYPNNKIHVSSMMFPFGSNSCDMWYYAKDTMKNYYLWITPPVEVLARDSGNTGSGDITYTSSTLRFRPKCGVIMYGSLMQSGASAREEGYLANKENFGTHYITRNIAANNIVLNRDMTWKYDYYSSGGEVEFRVTVIINPQHYSSTWKSDGTNHWQTCDGCGANFNVTGHTSGSWQTNTTQHWKTCVTCNTVFNKANHTLDAAGKCTTCGGQFHTHSYGTLAGYDPAPSCTTSGVAIYKCSCGGTTRKTAPAKGHAWGTPYVKKAATCIATGTYEKKCTTSGCNVTENAGTIAALGHDYQLKWYDLNGVKDAYQQLTCTRCGAVTGGQTYTKHTVTYKTVDKDNNVEIQTQVVESVNRGTKVSGDSKGTGAITYNGVPYSYDSCTSATVSANTTIYRYYRKTSYNISFDGNGGTGAMTTVTTNYDTQATLPANAFTRTGYTFKGWARTKTGAVEFADKASYNNMINRTDAGNSLTLYVVWEANKYVVSFADTKSNKVESITVTYDQPYGTLPTLTDENYRHIQWERQLVSPTDATDITIIPVDSSTIVTVPSDHTLYARWVDIYWNVSFITSSKSQTVQVPNNTMTVEPFTPNETGMVFKHWSQTQNGEPFDFNTRITEDMVLYGVFEIANYKITMQGAGHTERVYNENIGQLPNGVQTGFKFLGWYYDIGLTQAVNSTDKMPARDITIYPKFTAGVYKLTIKDRTENWEMRYGDIIPTLPTPTEPRKTFKGWVFQSNIVSTGDLYDWDYDVCLEPMWQTDQARIMYPDGNVVMKDTGSQLGNLPEAPIVSGKDFIGYVNQNGDYVYETTVVEEDMVISYKYTASTIRLSLHDGDWSSFVDHEAGVTATGLPSRSKDGYEFKGWSLYQNGAVTRGPFYNDTDLYAVYGESLQDIRFVDLNKTVQRRTGTTLGTLPEAYKDGYRFKGWAGPSGQVTSETAVPVGGLVLNAIFEEIDYSVTNTVAIRYWSDGVRINTVDLIVGETLWDPGAPAVSNVDSRHFLYWSATPGGSRYEFGHQVGVDTDLYAVWN